MWSIMEIQHYVEDKTRKGPATRLASPFWRPWKFFIKFGESLFQALKKSLPLHNPLPFLFHGLYSTLYNIIIHVLKPCFIVLQSHLSSEVFPDQRRAQLFHWGWAIGHHHYYLTAPKEPSQDQGDNDGLADSAIQDLFMVAAFFALNFFKLIPRFSHNWIKN